MKINMILVISVSDPFSSLFATDSTKAWYSKKLPLCLAGDPGIWSRSSAPCSQKWIWNLAVLPRLQRYIGVTEYLARFVCSPHDWPKMFRFSFTAVASWVVGRWRVLGMYYSSDRWAVWFWNAALPPLHWVAGVPRRCPSVAPVLVPWGVGL
jgi:hypothetical protein